MGHHYPRESTVTNLVNNASLNESKQEEEPAISSETPMEGANATSGPGPVNFAVQLPPLEPTNHVTPSKSEAASTVDAKDTNETFQPVKRKNSNELAWNIKRRSSSGSLKCHHDGVTNAKNEAKSNSTNTINFDIDTNCSNISEQINLVIRNAQNTTRRTLFKLPVSNFGTKANPSKTKLLSRDELDSNSRTSERTNSFHSNVRINPSYTDDDGVLTSVITNSGCTGANKCMLTVSTNGSAKHFSRVSRSSNSNTASYQCDGADGTLNEIASDTSFCSGTKLAGPTNTSSALTNTSSALTNTSSALPNTPAAPTNTARVLHASGASSSAVGFRSSRLLGGLGALQLMCSCWRSATTCLKTSLQGGWFPRHLLEVFSL